MIICDMDGCLSDDRWRRHLLPTIVTTDQADWAAYHNAGFDDSVNWCKTVDFIRLRPIVIFTARPERRRMLTHEWLKMYDFNPIGIYMRPDMFTIGSVGLKRIMLANLMSEIPAEEIECAYDDREDVVAMYREAGIKAEVLSVG